MRLLWTIVAGVLFAGLTTLVSAPLLGGVALVAWLSRGPLWTTLSGQSFFAVNEDQGNMVGRIDNVDFHPLELAEPGSRRPRRLLARLEVVTTEFSDSTGEGRVRLDTWPLDSAADLRKPPLYTVVVPGRGASLDADGVMTVEHLAGRHSTYSLTDGNWLFDADTPSAVFSPDGEHKRYVALAQADDDMPPGSVAVVTYATPRRVIRRLLLSADNPVRGRFLRGSVAMVRPVARLLDTSHRVLEVSLPAGTLSIALTNDDLDLATAQVPAGLRLVELRPWKGAGDATPPPAAAH
jgi:hypothetical protein